MSQPSDNAKLSRAGIVTVYPTMPAVVRALTVEDGPVRDLPGKRWWVALDDDGGAAGFVGAIDGDPVEIETLWVSPAARGRGIGGGLLGEVVAAYPGRRLHAWCSAGSRGLFERAGFRILQEAAAGAPAWWAEVQRNPRGRPRVV